MQHCGNERIGRAELPAVKTTSALIVLLLPAWLRLPRWLMLEVYFGGAARRSFVTPCSEG